MSTMKNRVQGVQPVFIDRETGEPLKEIWLYAFRHSESGDKLISIHRTDSTGRLLRRLYVPREQFDYYFFAAAFELGKTVTEKSSREKTKLVDNLLGDDQLKERAKEIITTESNLSEQNSTLIWVKNDPKQTIQLSFGSATHKALYQFRTSDIDGAWIRLDKNAIIDGMVERIRNPYEVHQRNTSLCGPTAVVFTLIFKEPVRYIVTMKELFENGNLRRGGETLNPDPDTFPGPVPTGLKIFQADWMLAATIRESENIVAEADSDVGGATFPVVIEKWGRTIIERTSVAAGRGPLRLSGSEVLRLLPAIMQGVNSGYFAITLLDGDVVEGKEPAIKIPTHWATITRMDYNNSDNTYTIICHSWGEWIELNKTADYWSETIYNYIMIN